MRPLLQGLEMFLDNFDLGGVSRVRWIIKLRDKLERYLSVWGTNTARDFRLTVLASLMRI
jgi:hypothetical protein